MPITQTTLENSADSVDRNSYPTGSISPSGNQLVILTVVNFQSVSTNVPTVTGNGLTWVQIATVENGTNDFQRLTMFRAMGSSPTSGVVTIDFGGQTQAFCHWHISEFDGVDTGGTDGSAAVVQSNTNDTDGATGLTVTLGAFASVNNATYGCFYERFTTDITEGSGFTEIADVSNSGTRVMSEWRNDNDTSVDASWSPSSVIGLGGAIEIAAAATTVPTLRTVHSNLRW